MKSQNKKNNNKKQKTEKAKKMWNYGITNTNIKQSCQESRYLFYCKYEQSLLMRGQKLFCAKKLWGGCSKLED